MSFFRRHRLVAVVAALAASVAVASVASPALGVPSIASIARKATKALKTANRAQTTANRAQTTANGAQTAATQHQHSVIMAYNQAAVYTAAEDVNSGLVYCPAGSVATGGGEDYVDGLATVEMGFAGNNAYYVLVDNFNYSFPSQVNVQVACTPGTGPAARRLTRAAAKDKVADMEASLEASHRQTG